MGINEADNDITKLSELMGDVIDCIHKMARDKSMGDTINVLAYVAHLHSLTCILTKVLNEWSEKQLHNALTWLQPGEKPVKGILGELNFEI
jgi:hypothetical protein